MAGLTGLIKHTFDMYKELFIFLVGFISGMICMFLLIKSEIGNDYEIKKLRQKGASNNIDIDQKPPQKKKRHISLTKKKKE